ncbi:hypothetical protein [Weizmannia acidilactici]|uniref:hypothetical protein n=1 Tax=Weizmannia acidilactici TaxID=2607726 RepID=UPI00124E278E|nr:hypothetical protein [Weizmannia acidilactici]
MDKDTFISMSPTKRVQEVNKMLQKYDLKEISKLLGIPSSTFSKLMREGDYLYHQADKKYYPFVRSEAERTASTTTEHSDEITFIKFFPSQTNLYDLQHMDRNQCVTKYCMLCSCKENIHQSP